MNQVQKVQNLNECQLEWNTAKQSILALCNEIQRVVLDAPAAADGNWSMVMSMVANEADLKEIRDRMTGQGEYAHIAKL